MQVRQTQRAIKHTLTERWYAWDNAKKVAAVAAEEVCVSLVHKNGS